ncbi:MAG: fused signal recognition particle receptor [Oceanicoccus sp.]|jgi:fused signal recognition particle receptor
MKFFDRFKSDKETPASSHDQPPETVAETVVEISVEQTTIEASPAADSAPEVGYAETGAADRDESSGFFGRLKKGLKRTSSSFASGMGSIFLGKKEIDDELLDDLETQLLVADVGIEATRHIMDSLAKQVSRKELFDAGALYQSLQKELAALLAPAAKPLEIDGSHKPYVILMVGVNGVGKTTTIGKLTKRFQAEGKSVMLAAGDTFRAAAVEQLQVWGERNDVPVIAQHTGADSASVIFDAVQAAQSRNVDILIADTAGRLHNKEHLMEELKKVVRVMGKLDDTAPHEVMLVLDAGTGQNALSQAKHFQAVVGVTGLTLTKLDGTAKGGIIFAISKQLQLPIRFIGVGEQVDDLRPFVADDFVAALFNNYKAGD